MNLNQVTLPATDVERSAACPWNFQGRFFIFFGMLAALFCERDRRPFWDTIPRSDVASTDSF